MADGEYFDFLRRVYFFKGLDAEEIASLAAACAEEEYAPGEMLFAEGATADRFYIIIEGRVEVWKNYYDPKPDLLALHGPGHFFGEMALVDELPRSATVVAKERVRVLYLDRADFRRLIRECTGIALSVMTAISFMVRSSNELFVEDLRARNAELERTNEELKRVQAERLRTERLSTLGKFSSIILHDIRNPLSVLKGQLMLMELRLHEPEKLAGHVGACLGEVSRLERLASEFLDYSRGEIRLDLAPARPAELVERSLASLRDRLESAGIRVESSIGSDEPLLVDADRLQRALANLIDNARKAMPGGGCLRIAVEKAGGNMVFSIIDDGEGMSEEVRNRVFEPFFSASGRGGTGLGMLIVRNIVEAHGGKIALDSAPGKGTTVRFALPLP